MNQTEQQPSNIVDRIASLQFKFMSVAMKEGLTGRLLANAFTRSTFYYVRGIEDFKTKHPKFTGVLLVDEDITSVYPEERTVFLVDSKDRDSATLYCFDKEGNSTLCFVATKKGERLSISPLYFYGSNALTKTDHLPGERNKKKYLKMLEEDCSLQIVGWLNEFTYLCENYQSEEVKQEPVELKFNDFALSAYQAVYGVDFIPHGATILE